MHYDTSEKSWQITGKRGKWARLGQKKNLKLNSSDRTKRGHELKLKVRKLKNSEKVWDVEQTDNQISLGWGKWTGVVDTHGLKIRKLHGGEVSPLQKVSQWKENLASKFMPTSMAALKICLISLKVHRGTGVQKAETQSSEDDGHPE
jgi:hypothetical protein